MNKPVVIYKSKYGSTKQYAQWIAQELSCDIIENKKLNLSVLDNYDTIVYGGNTLASMISGLTIFENLKEKIKQKML